MESSFILCSCTPPLLFSGGGREGGSNNTYFPFSTRHWKRPSSWGELAAAAKRGRPNQYEMGRFNEGSHEGLSWQDLSKAVWTRDVLEVIN